MADMTSTQKDIVRRIITNDLYLYELNRIREGSLIYERHTATDVFFRANPMAAQRTEIVAGPAVRHWYGAMSRDEYNLIRKRNRVPGTPGFFGIATNWDYASSYFYEPRWGNTHLIEFTQNDDCSRLVERAENCEVLGIDPAGDFGAQARNIDLFTAMQLFDAHGRTISANKRRKLLCARKGTPEYTAARDGLHRPKDEGGGTFGLGGGYKSGKGGEIFNLFLEEGCITAHIANLRMKHPDAATPAEGYYPADNPNRNRAFYWKAFGLGDD